MAKTERVVVFIIEYNNNRTLSGDYSKKVSIFNS